MLAQWSGKASLKYSLKASVKPCSSLRGRTFQVKRTARASALRVSLLQNHQEQVREVRTAGGGRLCFVPVRWSQWGTMTTEVTYFEGCMGVGDGACYRHRRISQKVL